MNKSVKHSRQSNNRFWKDPKAIIAFAISILGSVFWCGIFYQKTESNLEIAKIRGEYNNTINEERNIRILEACKYENEITRLKLKK